MAGSGLWWLLPLIGLVLMGVMFFVCFRGFARAGRRQRTSGELSHLQHEVERAARAAAVQSFPRGLDDRHVQGPLT